MRPKPHSGIPAVSGFLLSVFTACAIQGTNASIPDRPNIIVVVADDVSPAYLSSYGGRTPTPNLDRLAASGIRFDRAYSASSLCNPTRYTLFTGRYAGRNPSVLESSPDDAPYTLAQNTRLDESEITLARTLGRAGYTTGHVGKWHSNFEYGPTPEFPFGGDVETPWVDATLRARTDSQAAAVQRLTGFDFIGAFVSGNLDTHGAKIPAASHHNPEWQTASALEFIEQAAAARKPFYLHLANTIPHSPDNLAAVDSNPRYSRGGILDPLPTDHPPRSTIRERMRAAGLPQSGTIASINTGMIMLDDQMAALLARLEQLGIRDNTVVVFVGDHSVVGKGSTYAQGNHVPLLISWPAGMDPRAAVDFPVSLADIAPTLLEAAGAASPEHPTDGVSLMPVLRDQPHPLRDRAVFIEIGNTRSVIRGDWQYIAFRPSPETLESLRSDPATPAPDIFDQLRQPFIGVNLPHKPAYFEPDQLYHLANDPFCKVNLAADPGQKARMAALRADLAKVTQSLPRPFPMETPAEMRTPAYQASARAQFEEAAAAIEAAYDFDVERAYNLNLPTPETDNPSERAGKLPGQVRGH